MEKIVSAVPFYYSASKEAPNTARVATRMQTKVVPDILEKSVSEAMRRYPYFKVQVIETERELQLAGNDREIVVYPGSEPYPMGSEKINGHLLSFSYEEDYIYMDFFHGLADGVGIFPLLRTVLYYYCRECYDYALGAEGIHLPGEDIPAEEIEDPYPEAVDDAVRPSGKYKRKEALNLKKQGLIKTDTARMRHIYIPEDAFMKYSKAKDGSPAAMTALLMARAVDSLHKEDNLPIVCGMAVNARGAIKKTLAHHSVVSQVFLEYKESMKRMEIEQQATCIRGMVMLQSQEENLLDSIRNNLRLIQRVGQLPDLESKRQMLKKAVSAQMDIDTFKVSYVGKNNLGASEKYVREVASIVDLNGSGIMIEVNAVNQKFCMTFMQEWEEDIYFQAFLQQLEEENITYELGEWQPLTVASIAF